MKRFFLLISLIIFLTLFYVALRYKKSIQNIDNIRSAITQQQTNINTVALEKSKEGFKVFTISKGSTLSYEVKNELLNNSAAASNSNIHGIGGINTAKEEIFLNMEMNVNDFITTNEAQKNIQNILFENKTVRVKLLKLLNKVEINKPFSVGAIVEINLNGTTRENKINVEGIFTEQEVKIKGESLINLYEYAIKVPTNKNVFVPDNTALIKFEVLGRSFN